MSWKIEHGSYHENNIDGLYLIISASAFFGAFFQNSLLFIMAGIFIAYLLIIKFYEKKMITYLILENRKEKIRLFPGEEADITLSFRNISIFPFINGKLQFKYGPAIKPVELRNQSNKYLNDIKIPTTISGKNQVTAKIPVFAEQRGTARIHTISYSFPHLFLFDSIMLEYSSNYQPEFIVFPKPLPVQGIEAVFNLVPGDTRLNFSPFEDIQSPAGTRDYSYSDPFYRINWKASAKTQKLQTNIYDKTAESSFTFIVNLNTENNLDMKEFSSNLENLLSYTAYLCQFSMLQGISYEIFINSRKFGDVPYFHMHEGIGKSHYIQSLEMLARIERLSPTIPFDQLVHRVDQQLTKPKTIIFIGEPPLDISRITNKWKRRQQSLFHVKNFGDGAVLRPWLEGEKRNAK